jgi:hypothetical protein
LLHQLVLLILLHLSHRWSLELKSLIWGIFLGAIFHKIREKKIIVSQCKNQFSQQEFATLAMEKIANPPLPPPPPKKGH